MKTKERIVQAALELFNQQGERAITTNHIAAHLGISPGNLYYHFRNKGEIIERIFYEYVQHMEHSFMPPEEGGITLEVLMSYVDEVFESMWKFRFFYSNLPELLARHPELQQRYLTVQEGLAERVIAILKALKHAKIISIDDEYIPDLAHTMKIVVTFWISYQTTQAAEAKITRAMVYQGVLKALFILKPYFEESVVPTLLRLEQHYRKLAAQPERLDKTA